MKFRRKVDVCGPLSRPKEIERRGPMFFRYYIRARLHRRLFVTLGFAVAAMMVATFFATQFFLSPAKSYPKKLDAIEELFTEQFTRAWPARIEREKLADATHQAFGVALTLVEAHGRALSNHGGGCEKPSVTLAIRRDGTDVGRVLACSPKTSAETRKALFAGFFAAAFVLWLTAGFLAHRLGKPLWQLVQVTREIGQGRLESRARLGRHQPGEVGVLAESINDMAERIEKQLADQRELLAAVSHEIRTPLARLRVLSELLRDGGDREALGTDIEREIEEIDDLTGQLLATSRLDFGTERHAEVSLVELTLETMRRMTLDGSLLSAPEDDPLLVRGDATLLSRALRNVLHNALVHGERIERVELAREGTRAVVRVCDAGPGFPEGALGSAFDAFVRGPGAKKSGSSLGLGLTLVRRIARAHSGDAFAENRAACGAAVGFWIPA